MKIFSKPKLLNPLTILFLLISLSVINLYALPGDLDLTFDSDGKASATIGLSNESALDSVLLSDGKILVTGDISGDLSNLHIFLAKYNADSTLDTTFGVNGLVVSPIPAIGGADEIGVQSDGKIVVSGYRFEAVGSFTKIPILVRYNADGTIDTSFGLNGLVETGFSDVSDLLILPDDKILLSASGSQSSTPIFAAMKFNSNGTPDSSFGISGVVRTAIGSGNGWAKSAALQSDGKIVVAGYVSNGADYDFALVRYNADGTLDNTFDGDGRLLYPVGAGDDQAEVVKIQTDGKIVVAGMVISSSGFGKFGVVRFNSDGSADTTFNGTGKTIVSITNETDRAFDLDLQTDGKLVVSGSTWWDFLAIRLNANGSLDTSFDGDGKVILSNNNAANCNLAGTLIQADGRIFVSGWILDQNLQQDHKVFQLNNAGSIVTSRVDEFYKGDDMGQDIAVQADGKIVAVGYSSGANNDVSLARFKLDGSLDTSFGNGGKVLIVEAREQRANAVAIQPDGKIVIVGTGVGTTAFTSLAVYRFNADGSFDATFDGDGKAIFNIGNLSEGNDVAIQPDGKIVIAGRTGINSSTFAVFRVNADGTLDTTFNNVGYASFNTGGISTSYATAVALQSDGKIVAGGKSEGCCTGLWIRLNSDGTVDGAGGTGLLGAQVFIEDVAIQADGKIVFAGTAPGEGLSVTRFNVDKTLDSNFGNNGRNFANFSGSSAGFAMAIQPSGRIVVGGYVSAAGGRDFALARFNSNGFLDIGFGNGGKVVTQFSTGEDRITGLALQSDGKIVAGGYAYIDTGYDFAVARYDGGGSNTIANRTPFDFDGDGRADISVYRPSNSTWYQLLGANYQYSTFNFGSAEDVLAPADYDGDGKTDFGIFRPSTGAFWYSASASNGAFRAVQWGQAGDIPRPSDFNGDGKADYVVYRPSNSTWYRLTESGQSSQVVFGLSDDKPVIGDFDGDGKSDPAVYRPSTGVWWYSASSLSGTHRAIQFGISTDIPVPADFDGDGKTDVAVYRPSTGVWHILQSSNQNYIAYQFGISEDKPIVADYDGDGKADMAVYRPSNGVWYIMRSTAGFAGIQLGSSTDRAVPNAFVQ